MVSSITSKVNRNDLPEIVKKSVYIHAPKCWNFSVTENDSEITIKPLDNGIIESIRMYAQIPYVHNHSVTCDFQEGCFKYSYASKRINIYYRNV